MDNCSSPRWTLLANPIKVLSSAPVFSGWGSQQKWGKIWGGGHKKKANKIPPKKKTQSTTKLSTTWLIKLYLVGGFDPFEKNINQIGSFTQVDQVGLKITNV